MRRSFQFVFSLMLFLIIHPSFADVSHGNGYSYIVTGSIRKLTTDEDYINKFTKAFGKKLETINDRKLAPKLAKLEDKPVAYLLRDPGKARGERAARRTTTLAAFNQKIPQDVMDLAIAEFKATAEDFEAFSMGFRFKIAERKGNKFSARFYLYRKDKKRDGTPEMLDMGDGSKLAMPKGVYKHKTNLKPKIKGFKYTLWGRGDAKSMANELEQNLKDAGFETQVKVSADGKNMNDISIKFNKADVDGRIGLVQTSSKDPSVNLLMLVKSSKCQPKLKLGGVELYSDAIGYKCN